MIKPKELQDWLQVIGLFGVVASLIFVGFEMRQSQRIAVSQASQARTDTTVFALLEMAANPYILSGSAKLAEAEVMTTEERFATTVTNTAMLFSFENIYLQSNEGFIPQERWVATRDNLKAFLRSTNEASFRSVFQDAPDAWSASFQDLITELISEIDQEKQ